MDANPPVNWKGFMKWLHKPNVKARSQIEFLQIIDQPPDSYSTVYTTLIECLKTASAKPMVITFDLLLWLKASRIVLEKGMPVGGWEASTPYKAFWGVWVISWQTPDWKTL